MHNGKSNTVQPLPETREQLNYCLDYQRHSTGNDKLLTQVIQKRLQTKWLSLELSQRVAGILVSQHSANVCHVFNQHPDWYQPYVWCNYNPICQCQLVSHNKTLVLKYQRIDYADDTMTGKFVKRKWGPCRKGDVCSDGQIVPLSICHWVSLKGCK